MQTARNPEGDLAPRCVEESNYTKLLYRSRCSRPPSTHYLDLGRRPRGPRRRRQPRHSREAALAASVSRATKPQRRATSRKHSLHTEVPRRSSSLIITARGSERFAGRVHGVWRTGTAPWLDLACPAPRPHDRILQRHPEPGLQGDTLQQPAPGLQGDDLAAAWVFGQ